MVLAHPLAVAAFLKKQVLTWQKAMGYVSAAKEYQRQLGVHTEWESQTWLRPVQFEVMTMTVVMCAHSLLRPVLPLQKGLF